MIKLGKVDFLNCEPIYSGLDCAVTSDSPTNLTKQLLSKKLDLAPIPLFDYLKNSDKLSILPNLSISSDGKVNSVLLFSKLQISDLGNKSIALPTNSASSSNLLRILFNFNFSKKVSFNLQQPNLEKMLESNEAALLIGDLALQKSFSEKNLYIYDLGYEWNKFYNKKMVFAVFAVRNESSSSKELKSVYKDLILSKSFGLFNLQKIAYDFSAKLNLPPIVLYEYLRNLDYNLGNSHISSIEKYSELCQKLKLLTKPTSINILGGLQCLTNLQQ